MAMYNNYEDAFEDFKKMKDLKNRDQYIKTFIWCIPGTDGRINGQPSNNQNDTLMYKSAGVIKMEKESSDGGASSDSIIGEHVVPRTTIKKELLKLYETEKYNEFGIFKEIITKIVICLIKKE